MPKVADHDLRTIFLNCSNTKLLEAYKTILDESESFAGKDPRAESSQEDFIVALGLMLIVSKMAGNISHREQADYCLTSPQTLSRWMSNPNGQKPQAPQIACLYQGLNRMAKEARKNLP